MKATLPALLVFALATHHPGAASAKPREKDAPVSAAQLERIKEKNVREAREKMAADSKEYRRGEFTELEELYQKGNANPRTAENQVFLKQVLEKFPKSNRAGCAALYLGRYTKGDEQEKYLEMAIEKFSDCYYGDGTNVGGYARFVLGMMRHQAGKQSAAKKLFEELRKDYADTTDHGGRLVVENLPK
jgi:hypothetical protein